MKLVVARNVGQRLDLPAELLPRPLRQRRQDLGCRCIGGWEQRGLVRGFDEPIEEPRVPDRAHPAEQLDARLLPAVHEACDELLPDPGVGLAELIHLGSEELQQHLDVPHGAELGAEPLELVAQ